MRTPTLEPVYVLALQLAAVILCENEDDHSPSLTWLLCGLET